MFFLVHSSLSSRLWIRPVRYQGLLSFYRLSLCYGGHPVALWLATAHCWYVRGRRSEPPLGLEVVGVINLVRWLTIAISRVWSGTSTVWLWPWWWHGAMLVLTREGKQKWYVGLNFEISRFHETLLAEHARGSIILLNFPPPWNTVFSHLQKQFGKLFFSIYSWTCPIY